MTKDEICSSGNAFLDKEGYTFRRYEVREQEFKAVIKKCFESTQVYAIC